MKSLVLLPALITLLLFGCKKKEAKDPPKVTTPNDSISNNASFNGYFISGTYSTDLSNPSISTQSCNARFYLQPRSVLNGTNEVGVKKVTVNGDSLLYKGVGGFVLANPINGPNLSRDTWYVTGDQWGQIPSFSFSNPNPFPSCSNFNALPDTLHKSKGCTITLSKVSNINWGTVRFGAVATFTLVGGDNTITITPAMLKQIGTGTFGSTDLQLQYGVTVKRGGAFFRFVKETQIIKPLTIAP